MGYKFQFVTLAGFHSLNHSMFELSQGYAKRGMAAYSELQQVMFLCIPILINTLPLASWERHALFSVCMDKIQSVCYGGCC